MKWQDLLAMGLNIFKKRSRSRTIWIRGGIGFFSLIGLIVLLTGVSVEFTGDIECAEECISYVNVTSTYWRICFADDFNLVQTNPDVEVDVYVPARGKGNWRLFDPTKDCIDRKNKYNVLPNRFRIVGHKAPGQTVKWSVDRFDVDPVWIGIESKVDNCLRLVNETRRTNEILRYEDLGNGSQPVYQTEVIEICEKPGNYLELDGVKYNTKVYNLYAKEENGIITIDDCNDGNCDGICQVGESCCTIENGEMTCTGYNNIGDRLR